MKGKGKLPLKAYKGHLLWSVRGHARRMWGSNTKVIPKGAWKSGTDQLSMAGCSGPVCVPVQHPTRSCGQIRLGSFLPSRQGMALVCTKAALPAAAGNTR